MSNPPLLAISFIKMSFCFLVLFCHERTSFWSSHFIPHFLHLDPRIRLMCFHQWCSGYDDVSKHSLGIQKCTISGFSDQDIKYGLDISLWNPILREWTLSHVLNHLQRTLIPWFWVSRLWGWFTSLWYHRGKFLKKELKDLPLKL